MPRLSRDLPDASGGPLAGGSRNTSGGKGQAGPATGPTGGGASKPNDQWKKDKAAKKFEPPALHLNEVFRPKVKVPQLFPGSHDFLAVLMTNGEHYSQFVVHHPFGTVPFIPNGWNVSPAEYLDGGLSRLKDPEWEAKNRVINRRATEIALREGIFVLSEADAAGRRDVLYAGTKHNREAFKKFMTLESTDSKGRPKFTRIRWEDWKTDKQPEATHRQKEKEYAAIKRTIASEPEFAYETMLGTLSDLRQINGSPGTPVAAVRDTVAQAVMAAPLLRGVRRLATLLKERELELNDLLEVEGFNVLLDRARANKLAKQAGSGALPQRPPVRR